VYEGIITELRNDIDRFHNDNLMLRQKVEELNSLSFKNEELQEELRMYKETALETRSENMK
jgi:hypothetical protein